MWFHFISLNTTTVYVNLHKSNTREVITTTQLLHLRYNITRLQDDVTNDNWESLGGEDFGKFTLFSIWLVSE